MLSVCVCLNDRRWEGHHREESRVKASWGVAQVGEQKDASEGTAFPSCWRERCSCVRFAPRGHVCESVLSGYCKFPSAAGLSHLGCAPEGITCPSENFRCWLGRQRCLVEENLPGNEETWALSPLAVPSLHRTVLSVRGFSPRAGCPPAPQCESIPSIVVASTIIAATLRSDCSNPRVKRYGWQRG